MGDQNPIQSNQEISQAQTSPVEEKPKLKFSHIKLIIFGIIAAVIIAGLGGTLVLSKNSVFKPSPTPTTSPSPSPNEEPSPSPSCTPRPACLDAIPACKMPETSDMCPPSITPTKDDMVFCTQEAKQCPDGSYVSRTGPNCEFTACQ